MAENKKSFLLYTDVYHTVKKLTDEHAGILFKHILSYVNDEDPTINDLIIEIAFEPIKQSLKRDLVKYEEIIKKRETAGKIGGIRSGEIRRIKKEANEASASKMKQTKQRQANEAVNDSDSVSVSEYIKTWKDDFSIYMEECKKGYKVFLSNDELLKTQQRLNPGINIKLSIEKGYTNFWGTEAGWVHKKKSRVKEINWNSTIINSISMNKVYYTKLELERQS